MTAPRNLFLMSDDWGHGRPRPPLFEESEAHVKKIHAIWMLVLALLAASCGGGDQAADSQEEAGTPAGEESPAPADDESQAASGEAGSDTWDAGVDTVTFGIIMPFSGPIGFLGQFVENSVQVEVDHINEQGGIGGAPVEVVTRDTELNPQLAVQGAQELTGDDEVTFIIGPAFTGFYNAVKQIYEQSQTVNCNPTVSGAEALEGTTYTFRNQDPDQFRLPRLLQHLQEETDVDSIALVYENDDTGKGYDQMLTEIAAEYDLEYAGFQATRPDDQTHRPQVEAVADAGAILVSGNSTTAAKTAAAAEEIGYEGQLVGLSGLQGYTYVEGGGDAAEGTVFVSNYLGYFTQTPEEEWPEAYQRHVTEVIDRFGVTEGPQSGVEQFNGTALPADCVQLYARAANQAQSLEPDAVVEAWESLSVPAEEMPSYVNATFGPDDHEAYGMEDLFVYEWSKDDQGEWYLETLAGPEGLTEDS